MRGKSANTDTEEVTDPSKLRNPGPFDDIPRWIWTGFLGGWSAVFGLFVLFFMTDLEAGFAVAVATMFALVAFGLPMTMAALGRGEAPLRRGVIQTRSGPMSEGAAAVQIALIPIAAAIGLVGFILLAK